MRTLHALLHAMRNRRRPVPGEPPGPDHPGLARLLDAARAPATAEELAGEKAAVAAYTAHRRRAARTARRTGPRTRAVLVPATTGLALLILGSTAAAARTGNLPEPAQQHAHRLFSALGVPAPRTGPPPAPSASSSRPDDRPAPSPSVDVAALSWCDGWRGTGDRRLSDDERRKLVAAAGSEKRIPKYCADLHRTASQPPLGTGGVATSPGAPVTSAPTPAPGRPPGRPSGVPGRPPSDVPGAGVPGGGAPGSASPRPKGPPSGVPTPSGRGPAGHTPGTPKTKQPPGQTKRSATPGTTSSPAS